MNARVMALLISIAVALLLSGCSSKDQPVSASAGSAEIDATAVPAEVSALINDWYAALERADGSALDLYVPEGYHLYGDQRFDHDEILAHLQGEVGIEHEWITEPLLVAQDEDGRYVAVRGMRNTSAFASGRTRRRCYSRS